MGGEVRFSDQCVRRCLSADVLPPAIAPVLARRPVARGPRFQGCMLRSDARVVPRANLSCDLPFPLWRLVTQLGESIKGNGQT